MTTITINEDIKILKNNFQNINELKVFIYESFWYPEVNEGIEKSWYKNWKLDLTSEEFNSVWDMKDFYKKLRK